MLSFVATRGTVDNGVFNASTIVVDARHPLILPRPDCVTEFSLLSTLSVASVFGYIFSDLVFQTVDAVWIRATNTIT